MSQACQTSVLMTLPGCFWNVGSFLNITDLVSLEQVCLLNREVHRCLWEAAAQDLVSASKLWGKGAHGVLSQLREQSVLGKSLIQEMRLLRKTVFPTSWWKPWIEEKSFCSLKAAPCCPRGSQLGEDADADEDHWSRRMPGIPNFQMAAVPVSVGADRGQSLVVGIKIVPEGPLADNICIGIEACGNTQEMSFMIAPFSGHAFIQHANCGPILMTKDPLLKALDVVPASLFLWVQVFRDGGIRFLRQVEGQEAEDAGLVPPECFPRWVNSNFACMYFWSQTLKAAATLSVEFAEHEKVPLWLEDKPAIEMDTILWELLDADNW
eukprot:TRINITY_DN15002_c0_g1_i3.p1 TRINITY_DN15002_c0_g1~~TRINITY_DN15002_c0_g1_i3.p1  ORF type:complete len:323 (-),score=49.41 TRINITY_DN15002_c0_g1_i3:192-1160(-)